MAGDERSIKGLPSIGGRRNLRDEVIETLRGAVISGEMRPGVVYSAPTLAEQFGVSATPVREAMLDLVKEGLMETMRNKGFRVTEPTEHELDDLTELRALIEVPTVRRIAEAGVDADALERLRDLAAGIERASVDHDLIGHVRFDMEFHLALLGLAGNEHLVEIVRSLRARSRIYGLKVLAERGQLVPSAREHAELVDLIEVRDADGAEALMRRHIGHVRGIWAADSTPPRADSSY
ncbi:GntR family transcriptional regulator [Amycolatopsis sp. NPDC052450]|uniref:GntR family transcriptional regulator n=1 Tax=Amycolatopsis sp. NPDC052450 TaxID=3363937 RepID=UPI0037CCBA43